MELSGSHRKLSMWLKISICQDAGLSNDTVGTLAETVGLGPRVFAAGPAHSKGCAMELVTNGFNEQCNAISKPVLT